MDLWFPCPMVKAGWPGLVSRCRRTIHITFGPESGPMSTTTIIIIIVLLLLLGGGWGFSRRGR
jgi:LPXTG-motif cell wall-anchored protein